MKNLKFSVNWVNFTIKFWLGPFKNHLKDTILSNLLALVGSLVFFTTTKLYLKLRLRHTPCNKLLQFVNKKSFLIIS